MSVVARVLGHLFRLAGSYIAACLAAALVVAVALDAVPGVAADERVAASLGFAVVLSVLIGGFAALPVLVVVAIAEVFAVRAVAYWLVAFGVIGALPFLPMDGGRFLLPDLETPVFITAAGEAPGLLVCVAAGFVGGAVFWLLAGRAAGGWRVRRAAE